MIAAYKATIDLIRNSQSFLVTTHTEPDGDAVGCILAFASVLRRLGKTVDTVCADPVPPSYCFLEGSSDIVTEPGAAAGRAWDVALVLDAAALDRTGWVAEVAARCGTVVNIDHHRSNAYFGDENVVEMAGACGELVYEVLSELGASLVTAEAEALYVAILSDTGCFRFPTTTSRTLGIAAHLLDLGVRPYHAASQVYWQKSLPSLKILGDALCTIEVSHDGKIAIMEITQDMYREAGACGVDTEGFANYPRSIEGVAVGVLLRETERGRFRVSLRAAEGYDVDAIAKVFGGGGHVTAAGFRIDGDLGAIKARIRSEIAARLDGGSAGSARGTGKSSAK